jgi:hypothetical protein
MSEGKTGPHFSLAHLHANAIAPSWYSPYLLILEI